MKFSIINLKSLATNIEIGIQITNVIGNPNTTTPSPKPGAGGFLLR